jgi:hypothetical protein
MRLDCIGAEMNPHGPDLLVYDRPQSSLWRDAWSEHDHVVSEGGVEPFAYPIDGTNPWLDVAGQEGEW